MCPNGAESAAIVNGHCITLADVESRGGYDLYLLKKKLYEARSRALEDLVQETVLSDQAKKTGQSMSELLEKAAGGAVPPSVQELNDAVSAAHSTNHPAGNLELEYQARQTIIIQHQTLAIESYLKTLLEKADIKRMLAEPVSILIARPSTALLGNPRAPITLTVMMDYECPFCKRLDGQLAELLSSDPYRFKLRVIVKHFPLSIHPHARDAALAAICAAAKSDFPRMNTQLFRIPDHSRDALISAARLDGVDGQWFSECLSSSAANRELDEDQREGLAAGVDATPTLFLDGMRLQFADFEHLKANLRSAIANSGRQHE